MFLFGLFLIGLRSFENPMAPTKELKTTVLRLNLGWLDYLLVAIYFVFVLGIGVSPTSGLDSAWTSSCPAARCPRG